MKEIVIKRINESRFKAFVMFIKEPQLTYLFSELEYYSNEDGTILGTLTIDNYDNDYNYSILCRDEVGIFRCFDLKTSIEFIDEAREWLISKMKWHTTLGITMYEQGELKAGVDLFTVVVDKSKLHPYFNTLNEKSQYYPAKKIITEMSKHFIDIDGNFVEQFQSLNGFDSRLWELYLFFFLTEQKFKIIRKDERPDFILSKSGTEIAIEAVIVDRKKSNPPTYNKSFIEKSKEKIKEENSNDMPLRYGSPLYSKLTKKYWELPNVSGKPLIIAIADFHDDLSMTWSFNAILDYLYGLNFSFIHDKDGNLKISSHEIGTYKKPNGSEINAGFFFQDDVENISAVIFSSTATISKFNRIGIQAGFKVNKNSVIRYGAKYKHDANASLPDMFVYEVNENCCETWTEGINIFHNPNAKIPLNLELFDDVAHHKLKDGQIHSITPEFHPYFSYNLTFMPPK